jgi:YesN/AraC family two-component response regulator
MCQELAIAKEKALDARCTDYISKPIDKNELDALLKRYYF